MTLYNAMCLLEIPIAEQKAHCCPLEMADLIIFCTRYRKVKKKQAMYLKPQLKPISQ